MKTLKIVKIFLLLFMLIGCGKTYYFLKDKDESDNSKNHSNTINVNQNK